MRAGRARSLTIALTLLLGASAPVLASPGIACAAATSGEPHAALLIDTGHGATSYCVALDQASVDGMHLIALASDQYGLRYRLGFGGRAVCMLDGVGSTGDDCFGVYPNFWGYFHGSGMSGWTWSTGSAADHQVRDGDREAWTWGTGDDGATHAPPPATSIDDACGVATPPPSPPAPTPSPHPSPAPSPQPSPTTTASPSHAGGGGANGSGDDGHTPEASRSASPSPSAAAPTSVSPAVVRAAAASPPAASGPPVGGLVAIGAIGALGVGGWLMTRRRRTGG